MNEAVADTTPEPVEVKHLRPCVVWSKDDQRAYYDIEGEEVGYAVSGYVDQAKFLAWFVQRVASELMFKDIRSEIESALSMRGVDRSVFEIEFSMPEVEEKILSNFLRIEGLKQEASFEQQIKWLETNPNIIRKIWTQGYDGTKLIEDTERETALDITQVGRPESHYLLRHRLWCPELSSGVDLDFVYHIRRESREERRQAAAAVKSFINVKSDSRRIREDLDILISLFDNMVTRVEGFVKSGNPWQVGNLDDLEYRRDLKKIPSNHKYLVIKAHFDEDRAKNVLAR